MRTNAVVASALDPDQHLDVGKAIEDLIIERFVMKWAIDALVAFFQMTS